MCQKELEFTEFSPNKAGKHGIGSRCKPCQCKEAKERRERDPERARALGRVRDKRRRASKAAYMRKLRENPTYKLIDNTRRRVNNILDGSNKSASTTKLLGCSPQEFRDYMENKFTDGMTWGNYGLHGWHTDHITPLSIFNMDNPAEQHIAFHYMNCQPMWAEDNRKKSNKVS